MVAFFGLNPTSDNNDDNLTQTVVSDDSGMKDDTQKDTGFAIPEDSSPNDNMSATKADDKPADTSGSPFEHTGGWYDGGFGSDTGTFDAPKSDLTAAAVDAPTDPKNPFDEPKTKDEKKKPEPIIEDDKPSFSGATSGGSLDDVESKLKSKKTDLDGQIKKLQDDLKKIDGALGKISDLKSKESEMVKEVEDLV